MYYKTFHGEFIQSRYVDQVLREYFPDYSYKGVFFDIGAYEPINISNSYHFEKNGWDTYCFEANTDRIEELKEHRKNVYNFAISDSNKDDISFNVVYSIWGGGSFTAGLSAIDIDPQYLQKFRGGIKEMKKIVVHQRTLDTIIDENIGSEKIKQIDILSVDVEGGELSVLKGLNFEKYKPKILCIENVFNNNNIQDYLCKMNYKLDKQIEYNQFYVLLN